MTNFVGALSRLPFSAAVIVFGHYSYYILCYWFDVPYLSSFTVANLAFIYFMALYWVPAAIFEWMDRRPASSPIWRYKIDYPKREKSFWKLVPLTLRNHLLTYPIFLLGAHFVDEKGWPDFSETMLWAVIYYFSYDIIFYIGHRVIHEVPWAYKKFHYQHHTTHAMRAVCCHYMSWLDYSFEVILPVLIPMAIFGIGSPTFVAIIGVGVWNGIVVHSGWDLPFMPDPRHHLTHHIAPKKNYSLGLVDIMCGTSAKKELKRSLAHQL